jgi:hypothetical protein
LDSRSVYASVIEMRTEFPTKRVSAKPADHPYGIAEPSGGNGLVGSLAARVRLKLPTGQGFTSDGNPLGGDDEVKIDTADNDDGALMIIHGVPR